MSGDNRGLYLSYCLYQWLGITLVSDPYRMDLPLGLSLIFLHRPILPLESSVVNLHGHVHKRPTPEFGASHANLSMKMRDYRPWWLGKILAPNLLDQWMSGKYFKQNQYHFIAWFDRTEYQQARPKIGDWRSIVHRPWLLLIIQMSLVRIQNQFWRKLGRQVVQWIWTKN